MREVKTVGGLIAALQKFDPDAVVMGHQPPFNRLRVIGQRTGGVLVIAPGDNPSDNDQAENPQ